MKINRKDFIGLGMAFAASGCSTWDGGFPAITAVRSPNGLLRHASIGTANMAGGDIKSLRTHPKIEMAAFCDVDAKFLARMKQEFPKAHFYRDWRELLAKEGDAIDSMNISIPDHNHTIVAAGKGKHIYLQKPLCKSHAEAALLRDLAVRNGVVTQMGAQYTAFMADRQTVELLRTGALGPVEHAYFFSTRKGLSRRRRYLPASVPAPAHLDWDLWLGTAAARPYAPEVYHPLIWRVWRDLGSGWIGDIGCHLMSAIWKGMSLGKAAPLTVVAETQTNAEDNVKDIVWPTATHITWKFAGVPASGGKPFEWEWFDGCSEPDKRLQRAGQPGARAVPSARRGRASLRADACQKASARGQGHQVPRRLDPPAPRQGRRLRHPQRRQAREWSAASSGADPLPRVRQRLPGGTQSFHRLRLEASTDFDWTTWMMETILAGEIAERVAGTKLAWDPARRAFDCAAANAFLKSSYRKGWEIEGLS